MYRSFLIPVSLLALAAALSFWFTLPRWRDATGAVEFSLKSVAELRADETLYADAFNKMREIELARTGLAAKYNAVTEEDRTRLEKLLPGHSDSVRVVLDIENIARAHSLKLRSVSAGAPSPGVGRRAEEDLYQPIAFAVSALGAYERFVPFLGDVEASVRLADITSVDFESKKSGDYVYGVSFRAYQLHTDTPVE